jgi:hypothetical protein
MRKILLYSSMFFFWLAGITLVAHLILPHDHHNSEYFPNQNNDCPVENQNNDHKHGLPIHCHAFNDLAIEKTGKFIPVDRTPHFISDLYCESELQSKHVKTGKRILYNYTEQVYNFHLVEFFRLRAPPSLA